MPTIRERFGRVREIYPFAIIEANGLDAFVIESESMSIDSDGRLVFTTGKKIVGAVKEGQWQRVVRGVTLGQLTGEK